MHCSIWWCAGGGALLALAGHLDLIRVFGTVLPYRDQWQLTGAELIAPWLDGHLTLSSFFQPLNDHWPVLTRLLSFAVLRLNGQWNNLVETTLNACLLAGALVVLLRAVLPGLTGWVRPAFALLTGAIVALPIAWENTLWGIQSLPYLQILLTMGYLHLLTQPGHLARRWWLAQGLGVLVLFTQHSAILAQVAILPLCVWQLWRAPTAWRRPAATAAVALLTIAAFAACFPAIKETAHFRADSVALAVEVTLRQLAFPTGHPGWAFLLWAPWLLLAVDTVGRRRASASVAFVLVAGCWIGGQAAAIGYGRGAETYTFASRYCDFLALGFLLNVAALLLLGGLWPRVTARVGLVALGAALAVVTWPGFRWESTESHAGFNLSHRFVENPANLQRVRDYLATRDPAVLSLERGGDLLFTYPPTVQDLLNRATFRALLPPETGAVEARPDHGRLGGLVHFACRHPLAWALLGFGALGVGALTGRREPAETVAPGPSTWRPAGLLHLVGAAGLCTAGLWAQWFQPLEYDAARRARLVIQPTDPAASFAEVTFHVESESLVDPAYSAGATLAEPAMWRPFTFGTAINGPAGFQGILASSPFVLSDDYLSLLLTGFPCAPGNGLRWKITPAGGGEPVWLSYEARNPETGWLTWTVDVRAHRGATASLYFFDGRTDGAGWVGAARPLQTADPTWVEHWQARLRAERTAPAHRVLSVATLLFFAIWLLGLVVRLLLAETPPPPSARVRV